MSLELKNRIEASLGLRLSSSLLFTYPNLTSLTRYLLDRFAFLDASLDRIETEIAK